MPADEIHKGDIGTLLKITVKDGTAPVDVSSATTKNVVLKRPAGSVLEKPAAFFTDGTDGIVTYTTVSGDMSEIGTWEIQAFLIIGTSQFNSDIKKFKVHRNVR